jgi:glycerol-3-phosphate dehydrogenase
MTRCPDAVLTELYDLVIIGGGVYGLCTAWDASLRGLKVIVLEQKDFAHASSSVNYKLIHGGLRYLQHLDLSRMRISIRERRHMMTMAPHLVAPVEFVIPCYGHGIKGPEILRVALWLNDLMGFDRNRGIEAARSIPRGHLISRAECLRRIPGLPANGLTGGAVYYDAQMYSAERLALAFGRSAEQAGARLLNYAKVVGMTTGSNRIESVSVKDALSGRMFSVRGKAYANMTGPWSEITRQYLHTDQPHEHVVRSKGVQLFTHRLSEYGFVVQTKQIDKTAVIARGGRSLFVTPWRGSSFIGQSDTIYEGNPADFTIAEQDIVEFLAEFNEAFPAAKLQRSDVHYWLGGMIPVGDEDPNAEAANISHRYEILDHEKEDSITNLVSVIGVKFTISRHIAEMVVDRILAKLGLPHTASTTASLHVYGGDILDVAQASVLLANQHNLDEVTARHMTHLYGSRAAHVMSYADESPDLAGHVSGSGESLRAEIIHAIREEMAVNLDDVLIRRTDLGTLGYPGDATIEDVARIMAKELGWDQSVKRKQINMIRDFYRI